MIFRVNKNRDYTVMSNRHLRDKNLSLKAKGLLSQMLSLPDDWDYSVNGLASINKEEKTAISAALKELKENGYLKVTRQNTEGGQFEWVYDIFESPYTGFPCMENPCMENPCMENQPQLNTNKQSKDKQNTKQQIFTPPTVEEVRAYCEERNNNIDPEAFIDHYTANGWVQGKGKPIRDWKAALRQWERNDIQAGRKKTPKPMSNKSYDLEEVEKFW